MALVIQMGWDLAHYSGVNSASTLSMSITESGGGGAQTVTISSGQYCHTDITTAGDGSSILGGLYGSFATALKTALEAASYNTLTYTVTFSSSTYLYTISPSSGTVALTFSSATSNVNMRRLLGFSASQGTASSHTSDQTPWGVIQSAMGARSADTGDYEIGLAEEARAGSTVYHVDETDYAIGHDFTIPLEPKTSTYKYPNGASSAETFTYQDLFEKLRPGQPFLIVDDIDSTVHQMQAQGVLFKPSRTVQDYDNYWDVRFVTYMKGRL